MELNDFSSVFELLCGYNLVNAINSNSEILKVLDFTYPTKDGIINFKKSLKKKTSTLIEELKRKQDEGDEAGVEIDRKLQDVYTVRSSADTLERKNNAHGKKVNNLYLVAGLFCFFILILSPFVEEYNKLNSVAILLFYVTFLYFLFLTCHFPPTIKILRKIFIVLLFLVCLFVTGSGIFNYSIFKRNDHFFLLVLIPISLLIVFLLLRKWIMDRKIFKGIFIILFLFPLIIPDVEIGYNFFYTKQNHYLNGSVGLLTVIIVITALFPLIYDLYFSIRLARKLNALEKSIDEDYQKDIITKEIASEGIGKSQKDTNPVSGL